jgi:hypothetical protein
MFVGIATGVMGREAVAGETLGTSNKADIAKAAAEIAQELGFSGVITLATHKEREYQTNVSVGGSIRFRLFNTETAPKSKIPASLRPAKAVKAPKATVTAPVVEAPKRRGRPAGSKNKATVAAAPVAPVKRGPGRPRKNVEPVVEVKRGPGRPKGSTNAAKAAQLRAAAATATSKANTRKVATGTTRKG